jgi:hypothetical protein
MTVVAGSFCRRTDRENRRMPFAEREYWRYVRSLTPAITRAAPASAARPAPPPRARARARPARRPSAQPNTTAPHDAHARRRARGWRPARAPPRAPSSRRAPAIHQPRPSPLTQRGAPLRKYVSQVGAGEGEGRTLAAAEGVGVHAERGVHAPCAHAERAADEGAVQDVEHRRHDGGV